jgi:hypothetical protein
MVESAVKPTAAANDRTSFAVKSNLEITLLPAYYI